MSGTEKFNTDLPSMHYKRNGCAAAALGDKIFVVGGYKLKSAEMYDTTTKKWTTLRNSMSTVRFGAAAVSYGNSIIVMGGCGEHYNYSSVKEYNTVTERWSSFPSMNSRRYGCAAAVVDNKIIVVGGYYGLNFLASAEPASAEEYDPTTKKWVQISPMNIERYCCAAAVLGGQLYVVGGWNFDGGKINYLSSAEVYNPTTKKWTLINDMSIARRGCAAVSLRGKVVVVGGSNKNGILSSCEAYDISTHQWSAFVPMYTKREGCAAVEVEGTLYVMGGSDGSSHLSSMESLSIQPKTSQFYIKLFEDDKRNANCKMEELMNIVQDVHEMKFYYTFVNNSHRSGSITQEDRKRYIAGSLERVASSTTCYESIAIFKQLLDKARQDAIISDHEYYTFDQMAVVAHVAKAPFVKEIWRSLDGINTRVATLENRVDLLETRVKRLEEVSINVVESLQMLQKGIRRKQKIEAMVGMLSAVLNAVSFGFAGSAVQGVMGAAINSIVDFGDISHIQAVVESFGDVTVQEAFQTALDTISDKGDDAVYGAAARGSAKLREPTVEELMAAANDGNPLFAIVVTAKIISQEYDDVPHDKPIEQEEKGFPVSEYLDSLTVDQNLSNASTEEVCQWLSKNGILSSSLDIIRTEEIDGAFIFTESFDEIKKVLKEEGMKVGQISRIRLAIEKAKKEGYLA